MINKSDKNWQQQQLFLTQFPLILLLLLCRCCCCCQFMLSISRQKIIIMLIYCLTRCMCVCLYVETFLGYCTHQIVDDDDDNKCVCVCVWVRKGWNCLKVVEWEAGTWFKRLRAKNIDNIFLYLLCFLQHVWMNQRSTRKLIKDVSILLIGFLLINWVWIYF